MNGIGKGLASIGISTMVVGVAYFAPSEVAIVAFFALIGYFAVWGGQN